MKDFLKTSDLSRADLKYLLARAAKFKAKPHARRTALAGESVPAEQLQDATLTTKDNVEQFIAKHP